MLKMADSDMEESESGQVSKIPEKKRKSKNGISRNYAKDIKNLAIGASKSKLLVKSKNNLGSQRNEDKRVQRLEGSNSKTIIGEKRKIDTCTGTSSLLNDDKFTEIFKDVGSGKLKKVKRDKQKGKMIRNFNDSEITTNEHAFQTKCVEDSNLNSNCGGDNSTAPTNKKLLHPAINYLVSWRKSRSTWSFKKSRQVWLLKNMYDVTKLSNKHFKILTKYLKDLKGKSREETLAQARKIAEKTIEDDVIESGKELQRNRADKVIELLA